jgi:hypothetical protein
VSCLTGLLIYAHYQDCDPLTTKVMPTLFTKVTISYNSMNGNVPVSVNLRMSHKTRYIFFEWFLCPYFRLLKYRSKYIPLHCSIFINISASTFTP